MFWGYAHGSLKTTVIGIPKFRIQLSIRTVSYICFIFILNKMHYPETGASGAPGALHRSPIENEGSIPGRARTPAPAARPRRAPAAHTRPSGGQEGSPGAEAGGRRGSDRDSSGSLRGRGGDPAIPLRWPLTFHTCPRGRAQRLPSSAPPGGGRPQRPD